MSRPAFPPRSHAHNEPCRVHHWLVASTQRAGRYPARCRRCRTRRDCPVLDDQFNNEIDQLLPRQANLARPNWTDPCPLIAATAMNPDTEREAS